MKRAIAGMSLLGLLATNACLPKDESSTEGGGAGTSNSLSSGGAVGLGGANSSTGSVPTSSATSNAGGTTSQPLNTASQGGVAGSTVAAGGAPLTALDCSNARVEQLDLPWEPGSCDGPGFELPAPTRVGALSMTIVDEHGQPANAVAAQICTMTQCLPAVGKSDINGKVTVGTKDGTTTEGIWPTIEYGDGVTYPRWSMGVPQENGDIGNVQTFLLPALAEAAAFPQVDATTKKALSSAWVHSPALHLYVAEGGVVKISLIEYPQSEPLKRGLRAMSIPMDKAPAGVDKSLGFGAVVSATPSGATFCNPARAVVCNTPRWPAGTAVEFYVQSTTPPSYSSTASKWNPQGWAPGAGGWGRVAEGVVTPDGNLIATTQGGIPYLTNIGIRRK